MKIRIAVAEDNARTMAAILDKLASDQQLEICIQAQNGAELLEKIPGQSIDLILMDIEMPELNGILATKELKQQNPSCKIIMLTTFDDDEKIFQSILAGANGYLLKEETGPELVQLIRQTMNGGAAMSASIALKALQYIRAAESSKKNSQTGQMDCILTPREIELLELLKDGLGYKQIGAALQISEGTVRKHLENIYRKLQVNNKVSAINAATRKKWIF
ncbi:response regulator transcription factor [Flavihumibacter sp. UBA7668]|uniref:response regulator transcription factor n=1 Tax=Flavihumibacter sp. UBA7668 TaxID=1946542 RepID=UPI0025BE0D2A|nr:response regulator transcription factor [Flavihumibacter sp. UBA7668]